MLRELLDSLKIRLIHLWGGILPHEAGIRKPEAEEIRTIVNVGPHLHFADMKHALVFQDAGMAQKQIEKISGMFPKFGRRLSALNPGKMSREQWRELSVLFYGEPGDKRKGDDEDSPD